MMSNDILQWLFSLSRAFVAPCNRAHGSMSTIRVIFGFVQMNVIIFYVLVYGFSLIGLFCFASYAHMFLVIRFCLNDKYAEVKIGL